VVAIIYGAVDNFYKDGWVGMFEDWVDFQVKHGYDSIY